MKKLISYLSVVILLLTFTTNVWAGSIQKADVSIGYEIFENSKKLLGEELKSNNVDVVFLNESSGSSQAKPISEFGGTRDALLYSYQIVCHFNILRAWATATSSATEPIDYIYARAKTYNYDGAFLDSDEDASTNATYAGTEAANASFNINGDYAYGNHVFKNSGYQDMIRETYDEW